MISGSRKSFLGTVLNKTPEGPEVISSTSSSITSTIILSGYLVKKGEKGIFKSWARRHFVLRQIQNTTASSVSDPASNNTTSSTYQIDYHEQENSPLINSILLDENSIIGKGTGEEGRLGLTISNEFRKRVYHMKGASPEERDQVSMQKNGYILYNPSRSS